MAKPAELNQPQKQHLLSSCQYADKLLSEIESILRASESKSAFPKYAGPLSPAQARVVEDYIARIRAQIVSALRSQGIDIPPPTFRVVPSVRVTLLFAEIAFEECTADKMRGYGIVPPEVVPELNGLVGEIKALVERLSGYLGPDLDRDPAERLRRLRETGDETRLLQKLERVIGQQGLVDYRDRLTAILDRMESKSFEVALFGRVSSGKSSLLNHIVGAELLPVGVNPITAVPTRIAYGERPRLLVSIANRNLESCGIDRISEFVTEQWNPGNTKRVERLVIEYPSERLKQGVVLVDTPGLGSLASAGAAETLAYLPRCDLGIVLIDAGSTLTTEDISTLQALNQAAIESIVLLSKADLLDPKDVTRSIQYIADQLRANLRLELPVHAVSIQPGFTDGLDRWFADELAPRFQRHQELTRDSLRRKIGALRDSVSGTLRARLDRARHAKPAAPSPAGGEPERAEARLRRVTGRFEEVRLQCARDAETLRELTPVFFREAARRIVTGWREQDANQPVSWETLADLAGLIGAEKAAAVRSNLEALARELAEALRDVSRGLGEDSGATTEELAGAVKDMPRVDFGPGRLDLRRPWILRLIPQLAQHTVEERLRGAAGEKATQAFAIFGGLIEAWSRRVSAELQLRFNSYADAYRDRLGRSTQEGGDGEDAFALGQALAEIQASDGAGAGVPAAPLSSRQ